MQSLCLAGNKFEKSIPAEFGNFATLTFMDVGKCMFNFVENEAVEFELHIFGHKFLLSKSCQ